MLTEWQEHKVQLASYIEQKVADKQVVEDLLQEVYIKASTRIHQLQNRDSLRSWLYRISHNVVMDFFRRQRLYTELPEELAVEHEQENEDTYELMAHCLLPLIKSLPEKYSYALELTELEGKTQKELAERLGLSLSGAKSRVQRARKLVLDLMLSRCDFEIEAGSVIDFKPRDKKDLEFCRNRSNSRI